MSHAECVAIEPSSLADVVHGERDLPDLGESHLAVSRHWSLAGSLAVLTIPLHGCRRKLVRRSDRLLLALLAEVAQRLAVLVAERAREVVHDAERPDVVATGALNRLARIETNVRILEHE